MVATPDKLNRIMLNESAIDEACNEWQCATDLLFTRRDKVRCVVETYLEHANKHTVMESVQNMPDVVRPADSANPTKTSE